LASRGRPVSAGVPFVPSPARTPKQGQGLAVIHDYTRVSSPRARRKACSAIFQRYSASALDHDLRDRHRGSTSQK
jgi:hypothetical protein